MYDVVLAHNPVDNKSALDVDATLRLVRANGYASFVGREVSEGNETVLGREFAGMGPQELLTAAAHIHRSSRERAAVGYAIDSALNDRLFGELSGNDLSQAINLAPMPPAESVVHNLTVYWHVVVQMHGLLFPRATPR
jgi:hypothetical protein